MTARLDCWFAQRADGSLLTTLDAEARDAADLQCLECERPLRYRAGCTKTMRKTGHAFHVRPHFVHATEGECSGARGGGEGLMHRLAKRVLVHLGAQLRFYWTCARCVQRCFVDALPDDAAGVEDYAWERFRVDVAFVGETGQPLLLAEVYHTHLSTEEKLQAFGAQAWLEVEAAALLSAWEHEQYEVALLKSSWQRDAGPHCAQCVVALQREERMRVQLAEERRRREEQERLERLETERHAERMREEARERQRAEAQAREAERLAARAAEVEAQIRKEQERFEADEARRRRQHEEQARVQRLNSADNKWPVDDGRRVALVVDGPAIRASLLAYEARIAEARRKRHVRRTCGGMDVEADAQQHQTD